METAMQLNPVRTRLLLPFNQPSSRVENQAVIEPPMYVTRPRSRNPFIEANTRQVDIHHLRNECVVPVFSKDNEITISHQAFIETVWEAANTFFRGETIDTPEIRVSHIIKGRVPEAIHKPVDMLLEGDKTMYYERMAFCLEVPSISEDIDGSPLNLTIGGVRAYNHENLYSKKGMEKFKIFIGFKNLLCTNLCVSTDGYLSEVRVMSISELAKNVMKLFQQYNMAKHLHNMTAYKDSYLTEHQFAQLLGKSRLYQYLPIEKKKLIPEILITDSQINMVAKSYYFDNNFKVLTDSKEISMWKVYNLLTGANRSSYIDNFLDRSLNVAQLTEGINKALYGDEEYAWFID